ncbi:unnamed protein product [Trichogramma brassicae]|uniref:Uncharacterized protein n=1 Tax=Trichogramma brassicae TaxID=86971 RepID=A0A6H5HX98_9HYME|nr:unnamed protein product [Trichogramma brassicae]
MTSVKGVGTNDPSNLGCPNPCREQYLFLLEFYVRHVDCCRLIKLNQVFCVPTTIAFRFLDFKADDDLQFTPVDTLFEPLAPGIDKVETFYDGKSVLFALDQDAVSDKCTSFKIKVAVKKLMPPDIRPDSVVVGKAVIDMSKHFLALCKELIDATKYGNTDLPNPSKVFDDDVEIYYPDERCPVGTMNVYARISAHGQVIVTEIATPGVVESAESQDAASISSFVFKAAETLTCDDCGALSYKCKKLDPRGCDISEILVNGGEDDGKCNKGQEEERMPCAPCREHASARTNKCKGGKGEPAPAPTCSPPDNAPIQTSRGPKESCGKAVVLKVRDGSIGLKNHFNRRDIIGRIEFFQVSGLLAVNNDDNSNNQPRVEPRVTVASEKDAVTKADLEADPEHDVFILRIGKKGLVGCGEKSDIQLEMRTPKGPERRPPVRLETREIQTDDDKKGKGKKKEKGSAAPVSACVQNFARSPLVAGATHTHIHIHTATIRQIYPSRGGGFGPPESTIEFSWRSAAARGGSAVVVVVSVTSATRCSDTRSVQQQQQQQQQQQVPGP